MPYKIRTKLIIAFLAIIFPFLIIIGTLVFYNASAFRKAAHKVETVSEERAAITNIILALERTLMPGNDYIITGDRKYIDDFNMASDDIDKRMKEAEEIVSGAEDMNMLGDTNVAWRNIKEISQKIFEIQNPQGNKAAASLMEEMDYRWAYPAIERLKKWRGMHLEEYKKAANISHKVWVQSWIIMSAAAFIMLALGVFFAFFYSKIFVKPIKKLHNGADIIAMGDFKTRIDVQTGDEIEQLANAMNEMAAQLDNSYATLEQRVEERTRELKESEERYRGIFEKTPNAMVVFDAETWRFENVNRAAIGLYGYTEEEFLSLTPADISAEVEKTRKAVEDGLADKYAHVPVRYHKKKDGTVFPIEIFMGTFLSKGRPKGFAVIVDLTELKKGEEILKESATRIHSIVEAAKDAMICISERGAIYLWNKSAEEMFGYSANEAIGKDIHSLIIPERLKEKAYTGFNEFSKTGTGPVVGKTIEIAGMRKDGTEFPVELSISAMNIKDKWHAVGIIRDITERKKTEDKIKEQMDYLVRFEKATVQREFRMKELRDRVKELEGELKKKS